MAFIIGLLTLVMVVDCLILILLVLMQLPKKETGAGLAFGAGATDALFGAGSGNLLTKATKYAAIVFFAFAIILSVLNIHFFHGSNEIERLITQPQEAPPIVAPQPAKTAPEQPAPTTPSTPAATTTNSVPLIQLKPQAGSTNPAPK